MRNFYAEISLAITEEKKLLTILIDPDKFIEAEAASYLKKLPKETTHIFVGGSTVENFKTRKTVKAIKAETNLPVILFPGDYSHITETADALLFLSLISGRNPEYLIEQQVKSVEKLKNSKLEIIPTAYILIDGGKECEVQRVSGTKPMSQFQVKTIVNTALAGEFSGKKLIYLEAGSGADIPVSEEIITEVKNAISIPLIVGGGIRSLEQQKKAYNAGADMIVMGTHFEN
ncbi:geranylgeranylglyceryl/heptaprenylglyceryl phosphate synthase [Salegentibacter sp. JZCK2]|uniref:geranylgeranylglyceryl/heptaprenylglyceryl phosphate synthase n=1 Tax=Salegentibacter tibetensis TaxID=2873600 RepID=UPI001CC9AC42|nr:geranylgeranylglyceryl/heptaprenylglyceryl phosphate synthase [Salegentibacter tibetensis]MBZ9729611.1 geranylgeranylglyceryl/heptaprenylglyceryl phosphate synthase [Salegentibacter tibetensis]